MSCCENKSIEQTVEPNRWKSHAALAAFSLLLLLPALLLPVGATRLALLLLATAAGLWFPAREALGHLFQRRVDVDFLMLLVAIGAWLLGHPEEGVFLLVLFGASRAMEAWADGRTQDAIAALMQELPEVALRLDDQDVEHTIRIEDLRPAMRIALRPGERIPVDVRLLHGTASIDTSSMTGESNLIEAAPGDEIPSGAVNLTGSLIATVLRPSSESAYQKIIHLVRNAPARRSPAQILGERVGRIYTAVILIGTLVAFSIWWGIAGFTFHEAGYRALVLLVAGSPCALVLSIPSAVLAGIATGARRGILFHGGRGLLGIARVRKVAFDKTGTLTTGDPTVTGLIGDSTPVHLAIAHALASQSNHPASRAVIAWLGAAAGSTRLDVEDIHEIAGQGIAGTFNGQKLLLGRAPTSSPNDDGPATWLSIDGRPVTGFRMHETIRPGAREAMGALLQQDLQLMIVSGDAPAVVERLAKALGIPDARAALLPTDKHEILHTESTRQPIMMVGDGVNDAPALAAADVGVAMGMRGSAATISQADLVLMRDDLGALVDAVNIGRRTRTIVTQNIAISVGAATLLVAGALVGILPLSLGVIGHEGGTILVVLNSLRLLAAPAPSIPPPQSAAAAPLATLKTRHAATGD